MTSRTLRILTAVISLALALAVGWSVTAGNFFVPIIAIVLAIGLSYWLRKRTQEVTKDERTVLLYERAAGATMKICVPLAAVAGIVLFALRESLSPGLATAGYVLAYVACGLLLVHSAFYTYYNRKR
jgi:uncharacterized membrane protein